MSTIIFETSQPSWNSDTWEGFFYVRLDFLPEHFHSPVIGAEVSSGFLLLWDASSFVRKNVRSRNSLCWSQVQLNTLSPHTLRFSSDSLGIFYCLRVFLVALRYLTQISTSCAALSVRIL